jgi:hypothetical protein
VVTLHQKETLEEMHNPVAETLMLLEVAEGQALQAVLIIQVALMEALEEQDNQAVLQVHQSLEQAVAVAEFINQEVEEMVVLEEERPQMGLDQLTLEAVEAELI